MEVEVDISIEPNRLNSRLCFILKIKENKMEHSENEAKRQSQVTEQVNRLEGNLTALHDNIGKLTDRLVSVLGSSVSPEQEKGQDRPELVILACTIEGFDDSVQSAIYKIEGLLDRIEL